jgi:hypothetical protein
MRSTSSNNADDPDDPNNADDADDPNRTSP